MIEITKTEIVGWEHAIRGMRNPMNSWDKSDSSFSEEPFVKEPTIGENDLNLAKKLSNAGTDHGKYLRFIQVYCDIEAPLYFYKELDTYRMGVEKNSCSTMHKIHEKEFTLDDFSHEHLLGYNDNTRDVDEPLGILNIVIDTLNEYRKYFINEKDKEMWWQMIQLLPSSYNQKRTYMFSYQALKNMYHARKNHKLDEWHTFCEWIESLPYSELITGELKGDKDEN